MRLKCESEDSTDHADRAADNSGGSSRPAKSHSPRFRLIRRELSDPAKNVSDAPSPETNLNRREEVTPSINCREQACPAGNRNRQPSNDGSMADCVRLSRFFPSALQRPDGALTDVPVCRENVLPLVQLTALTVRNLPTNFPPRDGETDSAGKSCRIVRPFADLSHAS